MKYLRSERQKKIYDIISIVKLVSLLFCFIIIYSTLYIKDKHLHLDDGINRLLIIELLICSMLFIYLLGHIFSQRIFRSAYFKQEQIIEDLIFLALFSIVNILYKGNVPEYKFMFLFIIIVSTIELGLKYGIVTALISSFSILTIDLIYFPVSQNGVNFQFQNDLIVAAVYILTAWPLGHYVEIENYNLKKKDKELKNLNKELTIKEFQHRDMEQMLLNNEICYNLLIENSRDAIFVHRYDRFIFINDSAAKFVGISDYNKLSDMCIYDFVPEKGKKFVSDEMYKIYNEKQSRYTFYQKILNGNGQIVDVQNISTYFIYEGKPTILSIIHDITTEKQVERLQKDVKKNIDLLNKSRQLNKLITEFLANISHELKTPLNVIFSAIQVLDLNRNFNSKEFKNKQNKYLRIMKQNCYRLMRLISNLLDITKINSGFLKLNLHNRDIVSLVEDITLSIVPYFESRKIELTFDTDVEEKIMAVDSDKMERIILNLLSNSIKFTKPGGRIFVNINDKENVVLIKVRDTGIGIPEDKMSIIFERFGQVNKSFRREREGSGIGLYLVKSFVELHGGKIYVKSKLGIGSEFIIKIPVKVLDEKYNEEDFLYENNDEKINMEFSDIY